MCESRSTIMFQPLHSPLFRPGLVCSSFGLEFGGDVPQRIPAAAQLLILRPPSSPHLCIFHLDILSMSEEGILSRIGHCGGVNVLPYHLIPSTIIPNLALPHRLHLCPVAFTSCYPGRSAHLKIPSSYLCSTKMPGK